VERGLNKVSAGKLFIEGIFQKNPVFRLMLGLVPAVGATTVAWNSLLLGLMTAVVLIAAAIVVTLLRPFVPKLVMPIFHIAILTVLVTMVQRLMITVDPHAVVELGIYIPLIVVNAFVLQRLETELLMIPAILDAAGQGIGFTAALVLIGAVREFLAFGRIFDWILMEAEYSPFALANTIPGSLLIVGLLLALVNALAGKGGELNE